MIAFCVFLVILFVGLAWLARILLIYIHVTSNELVFKRLHYEYE